VVIARDQLDVLADIRSPGTLARACREMATLGLSVKRSAFGSPVSGSSNTL
jgi:hypothetical protein